MEMTNPFFEIDDGWLFVPGLYEIARDEVMKR
jgi:hypothetical protein